MQDQEIKRRLTVYKKMGAKIGVVGKSAFGRKIRYVAFGNINNALLVTAAIHAREYPTTLAAFGMFDYAMKKLDLSRIGIVLIPCANPDGVALVQSGLESAPKKTRGYLRMVNGKNTDYQAWKANGRAVDLNVNFPAQWGKGRQNCFVAMPENFVGPEPASEPETVALMKFTRKLAPNAAIHLHAKGREIYWEFGQMGVFRARDRNFAQAAKYEGYRVVDGTMGSTGGFKDWCVETLEIPSITVEIGREEATHPLSDLEIKFELGRIEAMVYDCAEHILKNKTKW